MKPSLFILCFLLAPLFTFAKTETNRSNEFFFDSLRIQSQNQIVSKDTTKLEDPKRYEKIAKTSGLMGIIGFGVMIILGLAGFGTFAVLIGSAFLFAALILGASSVSKVRNKKWARAGIILGSLGIALLIAWIGLLIYVISNWNID